MAAIARPYFANRIAECRDRFEAGRSESHPEDERGLTELRMHHYRILARRGQVVWGCIAQANKHLFSAGQYDAPANTVYSIDRYYDANPQDLSAIGRACFLFKNSEPRDPDFQVLAARLTDEYDGTLRMPLPKKLTDHRAVFMAATFFHRNRLPDGILRGSPFPLVIAPDATEVNMVLPLRYWSERLFEDWISLQSRLEGMRINNSALEVARAAGKRPAKPPYSDLDFEEIPIYVTPALGEAFVSLMEYFGCDPQSMLAMKLQENGDVSCDVVPIFDPLEEEIFESNGVVVTIHKDLIDRIRGSILDYRNNAVGRYIFIRQPER